MLITSANGKQTACDGELCLEIGPPSADAAGARDAALRLGWREFGGNIFCPLCARDELQIHPDHLVEATYQI